MAKDYAKTKTNKSKPRSSSSAGQESTEGRLWLLAFVLFVLFVAGLVFLKHESKKMASDAPPTKSTITQTNQSPQGTTPQPKFDFYSVLPGQQTAAPSQNNSSAASNNSSNDQSQNQQGNSGSAAPTSDASGSKSQIPAPSSDFSQSSLQQQPNSQPSSTDNAVNSQSASQQDQTSQATSSDASSSGAASASDSSSSEANTNSDNSSSTTSPQQQVSDLVKQQLDEESDSSSSNSCHGIINPSMTNYILQLGLFADSTAADQQRAQLVIQGLEVKIKSIKKNGTTYYRIWMGPYKTKQDALKQQQQLQSNSVKSELIKQSN